MTEALHNINAPLLNSDEYEFEEEPSMMCKICQEEDSISIYKDICANCYLKSHKYN